MPAQEHGQRLEPQPRRGVEGGEGGRSLHNMPADRTKIPCGGLSDRGQRI